MNTIFVVRLKCPEYIVVDKYFTIKSSAEDFLWGRYISYLTFLEDYKNFKEDEIKNLLYFGYHSFKKDGEIEAFGKIEEHILY